MKKAFSLLEVVVSMLLLGLIITGMLSTFVLVGKGPGRLGIIDLQAVNYARETLEWLRNAVSENPIRSKPLNVGSHDDTKTLPATFKDVPFNGSRTYDVTDIDVDKDGLDYKKVTVTVKWND